MRCSCLCRSLVCVVVGLWSAGLSQAWSAPPGGIATVTAVEAGDVDFERHVAGLFGRLGCNSAACHGSFQGKGGYRLSLFGQSPADDYAATLGSPDASRVDPESPDESLLLRKPSGRDQHGGGVRLPEDSREYLLLRRWIAAGARRTPDRGKVVRLVVEPQLAPLPVNTTARLRVFAEFAAGDREDVTPFVEFRSRDEQIAVIAASAEITTRAPGATSISASYRGESVAIPVLVPFERGAAVRDSLAANNWIDEEVNARLDLLQLDVSPPALDAEFLRRVSLDVIGLVPSAEEVRDFSTDLDPDKRAKRIEWLLSHPRRAAWWATRMCDVTGCNVDLLGSPEALRPKRARMWHDWFRKRFADNVPYDRIAYGVLCATSRQEGSIDDWITDEISLEKEMAEGFESSYRDRPGLDLFWRRMGPQGPLPVEDLAELTATAFLGLRLHCARCHQHPYDRWTQDDFAGYARIFDRVEFGSSTELRTAMIERLERRRQARQSGETLPEIPRLQEVFLSRASRPLTDAAAAEARSPKAPGGPLLADDGDPREALFRWLTGPENPYFAASFVNRVWAKYFGAGLVEPVDDFAAGNPATHPRVLQRLSDEFIRSGYDIRALERLILSSAAYQRSSRPVGNNASDGRNFAQASVRPLPAEVLVDSLNAALEANDNFGKDVPQGSQAIELAPNRFADASVNELFRILGRGDRKSACECDRTAAPSIRQTLLLMSDPGVIFKIRGGRLARLVAQGRSDAEIVDEFYRATFSRSADADELEFARKHVAASADRIDGLADIVWGLINSREFTTNR